MITRTTLSAILSAILLVSCATSTGTETASQPTESSVNVPSSTPIVPEEPMNASGTIESPTLAVPGHLMRPADIVPAPGGYVDDVEFSGTGPEGRALYGDSLDLNRFERPFSEDMIYLPELDIHKFGLSEDADWYYISIQLIGSNPNNSTGINYEIEIDQNALGYRCYSQHR